MRNRIDVIRHADSESSPAGVAGQSKVLYGYSPSVLRHMVASAMFRRKSGKCQPMQDTQRSLLRQSVDDALSSLASSAHRIDHTFRVVGIACWLAGHYQDIDHDVVEAAAWLHDVGRAREHAEGISHAVLSAQMAETILPALHFTAAQVRLACDAIADHRFSAKRLPASLEGQILQDADRLDALGAIGIARTFAEGGGGRALYCHADPLGTTRPFDDDTFTFDHFFTKLLKLPETLHTEEARGLASQRLRFMEGFIGELVNEATFAMRPNPMV